jgi:apolipoprotein N-acyltransferase
MRRRRGAVVLPALASGALLALSLPPFGAWPAAFLGAALFFWRLGGLRLRTRLLAGWLVGVGCFAIGLFWAQSFNWYGAVVLVAVEALFVALAAALTPPAAGRVPAFVGAATLLEAARQAWPFGGLPVGGVYLGQGGGPLLALARLGGPLLITAAVFGGGVALAELARFAALRRAGRGRGEPWAGAVCALLVVAGSLGAAFAPDGGPAVGSLRVAAVQGGGERGLTELETGRAGDFSAQYAATTPLLRARDHPRLVLWPEDVIAIGVPVAESHQAQAVARLARALRATVLAGVTITESGTRFSNEIVAWGPKGAVVAVFEKVHRVPFGEYVPFRGFFSHLASLAAVPRDAIAGHGTGLMSTPAGPLGVLVSFEVFFADRGRSAVRAGARLLVVPTNTSSYATAQMPAQEVAADRVQAVAEGRDLVQADPTGYSTLVTHDGAVVAESPLGVRSVLEGTVALRRGATVYERAGDLPVVIAATTSLLAGLAAALLRRRRDRRGGTDGARR